MTGEGPMSHTEIKSKLSEYRDGELSAADRLVVEKHLPGCIECQEWLQNWDLLSDRLFPATPLKPAKDLTQDVFKKIGVSPAKPRRVPAYWLAPAVGIAAVLVLSITPLKTLNQPTQTLASADDVYNFILTENGNDAAAMDLIFS